MRLFKIANICMTTLLEYWTCAVAVDLLCFQCKKSEMVFVNDEELFCARNTEIRIDSFVPVWMVIEAVGKAKGF